MTTFQIDPRAPATPFPHVWEKCVGSTHAVNALRADYREQLRVARAELGFETVRFHGWLSDDMRVVHGNAEQHRFDFFHIDSLCDCFLSLGMKPFVGLCFMPQALASGNRNVFFYHSNVTEPRDPAAWGRLHEALGRHLVERYGAGEVASWLFEVWNEPNEEKWFWPAGQEAYFRLYETAARALRRADPGIRVGGPATSRCGWLPEFHEYCRSREVPLSFLSTHQYPTDATLHPSGDIHDDMAAQSRDSMREMLLPASRTARAAGLPLLLNEWHCAPSPTRLYDESYAAAFAIRTVASVDGLADIYGHWTFSDLGEWINRPFKESMGLMTVHGVRKPVYRAFQLLRRLGTERLPVAGAHPTVEALAVRRPGFLDVLLTNWERPRHAIGAAAVELHLQHLRPCQGATLTLIDEHHANPRRVWQEEMGAPDHLLPAQIERLHDASTITERSIEPVGDGNGGCVFRIALAPQGVAALRISLPQ